MSVHAVMRAWRISREQPFPHEQKSPAFSERAEAVEESQAPVWKRPDPEPANDEPARSQEAAGLGGRSNGIVPRRRGAEIPEGKDSFWSSDLFWKGVVIGVLASVVVKLVLEVQAPFGVGWYGY